MERERVAGPDTGPEHPFPIRVNGRVIKGFGRGSKELGIPTANIPITGLDIGGHTDITSGVYFGWAGIDLVGATSDHSSADAPPGVAEVKAQHLESRNGDGKQHQSSSANADSSVRPAVLSIGYNPYYKNEARSVEIHIIHDFKEDFYNAKLNLSIMGFIRPERDYESMQALVEDIHTDVEVAKRSLSREAYMKGANDPYLSDFSWN